jgi:hypothetical protein
MTIHVRVPRDPAFYPGEPSPEQAHLAASRVAFRLRLNIGSLDFMYEREVEIVDEVPDHAALVTVTDLDPKWDTEADVAKADTGVRLLLRQALEEPRLFDPAWDAENDPYWRNMLLRRPDPPRPRPAEEDGDDPFF